MYVLLLYYAIATTFNLNLSSRTFLSHVLLPTLCVCIIVIMCMYVAIITTRTDLPPLYLYCMYYWQPCMYVLYIVACMYVCMVICMYVYQPADTYYVYVCIMYMCMVDLSYYFPRRTGQPVAYCSQPIIVLCGILATLARWKPWQYCIVALYYCCVLWPMTNDNVCVLFIVIFNNPNVLLYYCV